MWHLIPTSLAVVFLLLAATIPIGFVFASIAVVCRWGREVDPELSVRQKLVDWSSYTLGGAAVLCLLCFLSIRNGRSPAIVFGGLGLAFLPISLGLALRGRGAGKIAILIAHGLLLMLLFWGMSH